jgi:FtsZ-binding cell division protein ZapB
VSSNDFETVRLAIDAFEKERVGHKALDRIEAEMEKKAVWAQSAMHSVQVLEAEVERLRKQRCDYEHLENIATLQMEVERLRDDNGQHLRQWTRDVEDWKRRFEQEKEAFAAEHAEVERLRAAIREHLEYCRSDYGDETEVLAAALAKEEA